MKKRLVFLSDKNEIIAKSKEVFSSVLPIIAIILLLVFTICPVDSGLFASFIIGGFLVVLGMGIFNLGADIAMSPIGEYVGSNIIKSKKIWLIIPVFFIIGVFITISEPDLQVLAGQLEKTINYWLLISAVGIGVGLFLVVAFLRVLLKIKLKYILLFFYVTVFVLAFFVPKQFLPLSFDAGGVTTGPMSVPFIIAIGTGVVSMRSDKGAESEGFGLTALCSIGPILAVMILGIIYKVDEFTYVAGNEVVLNNSKDIVGSILTAFPKYLKEVGLALLPIVACFFITRIFGTKTSKTEILKIIVGIVYTYFGLVIFLVGVYIGFLPMGSALGKSIAKLSYNWIVIPIGAVLGFFVVSAEPAVHVLTEQVFKITKGEIPKKTLKYTLMIGVGISIALALTRIFLKINILYFLIPSYAIALVLMFIVPDIFTAIAFDSGGVASGAMTANFILPFAVGFCIEFGSNIALEGFGVVAMVAMTPLIAIQILGLIYKIKVNANNKKQAKKSSNREEILD